MKITSVALPNDLTDRIDQVARDSERSRSFVVRKLLEQSLNGADRLKALQEIAAAGLEEYAADHAPRERPPNATAVLSEAATEGRRMLEAHQAISRKRAR